MSAASAETANELEVARARAELQTQGDFGVTSIAPAPSQEVLRATHTPQAAAISALAPAAAPVELPAELSARIDAAVGADLAEKLQVQVQDSSRADSQLEEGQSRARADAEAEMAAAERDTVAEQHRSRDAAGSEVDAARQTWRSELTQLKTDAAAEADQAQVKQSSGIASEQSQANAEACQHYKDAKTDADEEATRADQEVAQEKSDADRESGGFIGWVASKARALIDTLKLAVNKIYDGLRAAVKRIFEAAKRLALAAIERARQVIVRLITAFGELLKAIVQRVLAAFPKLAERIMRLIDQAVSRAVELVNQAAELLKTAVSMILDALAWALDTLLAAAQAIYNTIFDALSALVNLIEKALRGIANLYASAKAALPQFEAAVYSELLGGDMSQPLSPEELKLAGLAQSAGGEAGQAAGASAMPTAPWTLSNVGVDEVVNGAELDPALIQEVLARTGGDGDVEFGQSNDPSRSMGAILGQQAGTEAAGGLGAYDDGLTVRERAGARWSILKRGLAEWWSKNWPYVVAGVAAVAAAVTALTIVTEGAFLAILLEALPLLMEAMAVLFMAHMLARVGEHLKSFLTLGWEGNTQPAGKSLATAMAIGAVEALSWLTFRVGGAAFKAARGAGKAMLNGTRRAARAATQAMKRGANFVIRQGKVLLKGVGGTRFGRGLRRLGDLGRGLLQRTRFRGFKLRIRGRRWTLYGIINPEVPLASGHLPKRRVEGDRPTHPEVPRASGHLPKSKKRGPKTDPRAPHNAKIRSEADKLRAEGNDIIAGGGGKESLIRTPGGLKSGRRPDILYRTPSGEVRGRNVGKTLADGSPVPREIDALNDLNGPGGIPTDFVPYDR